MTLLANKFYSSSLSMLGNFAWKATTTAASLFEREAPHPSWAPGPLPRASERQTPPLYYPRATKSICPKCNEEAAAAVLHGEAALNEFRDHPGVIDAELVEEAGQVLMRKACSIHGPYQDVISTDASFSNRINSLYFGQDFQRESPSPADAHGPFTVTTGRGSFLIVDLTNRCNMKCSPCFMDANNVHYVHEMSLDDVKVVFDNAKAVKPHREISILFSGGEPTISPIFLDAIRYARQSGFTRLLVATNGIRIAEDPKFAEDAKAAGLQGVYLQIDGVTNSANLHRGISNFFDVKCRALENIKRAGMRATLQVTVINGLNNDSLAEIVDFAVHNSDVVQGVVFQPIMFAGRDAAISDEQRYAKRYTLADLAHDLSEHTCSKLQVMRDWFPMSAYSGVAHVLDQLNPDAALGSEYADIHPHHGVFSPLVVNREAGQFVPLADFFNVEGFLADLRVIGDRFTGRTLTKLQISASIARHYRADRAPAGFTVKNLVNLFTDIRSRLNSEVKAFEEGQWRVLFLAGMWFQDLFDIDLTSIQMSSTVVATETGEISFCAYNAGNWRAMNEELNSTARLSEWHRSHGRHTIYANGKLVNIDGLPVPTLTVDQQLTNLVETIPTASVTEGQELYR